MQRQRKRTRDLFIDDLTIYPVSHQKLEAVNEMIVKASMDTEACYGVKKYQKLFLEQIEW